MAFTVGGFVQTAGALLLTDGGVSTPDPFAIQVLGGTVEGVGTIAGRLLNSGLVRPGSAVGPGTLTVRGTYDQTATGVLEIEWRGPDPGAHDQLDVSVTGGTGAVTLDGSLRLLRFPGFVPVPNDSFAPILYRSWIGAFSTVENDGVTYALTFGASSATARVVNVP